MSQSVDVLTTDRGAEEAELHLQIAESSKITPEQKWSRSLETKGDECNFVEAETLLLSHHRDPSLLQRGIDRGQVQARRVGAWSSTSPIIINVHSLRVWAEGGQSLEEYTEPTKTS